MNTFQLIYRSLLTTLIYTGSMYFIVSLLNEMGMNARFPWYTDHFYVFFFIVASIFAAIGYYKEDVFSYLRI
jgi:hypothetical protein